MQPTRVDAEYVDLRDVRPDDIGQHHRLGAEAVRIDDTAVRADGGGQLLPNGGGLLFEIEIQQLSHGAGNYSERLPGTERMIPSEGLTVGYRAVTRT